MARPFNSPDVFRAVSHPVRRRILDMLRLKDLSAGEITKPFRLSKTTISEHLRALRSAGLIEDHDRGTSRIYRLLPDRLREFGTLDRRVSLSLDQGGALNPFQRSLAAQPF